MAGIIWKWKKKIAVVGGGITGLVAGYRLNKKIGGTVFNDFVQRIGIYDVANNLLLFYQINWQYE